MAIYVYTLQNSIVMKRGKQVYFESCPPPVAHKSISIGSRILHLRKEDSWDIRFMSTSIQLDNVASVKRWRHDKMERANPKWRLLGGKSGIQRPTRKPL